MDGLFITETHRGNGWARRLLAAVTDAATVPEIVVDRATPQRAH